MEEEKQTEDAWEAATTEADETVISNTEDVSGDEAHSLYLTETNGLSRCLYERIHGLLGEMTRLQEQVARQQEEIDRLKGVRRQKRRQQI